MQQLDLGKVQNTSKLESLSQRELIQRLAVTEAELSRVLRELYQLRQLKITDEQLNLLMQEQLEDLRDDQYGKSSERYKKPVNPTDEPKAPPKPRVKKPSERYPDLPVREERITQDPAPSCPCCGKGMSDSGMTEDSEQLTVIPKKYEIVVQKRVKYRCSCQGAILTAPAPPRIIPGSSYSDEMILDVALSKYCDLIPIERYAAMAARGGVKDLPPHSLIELTHGVADFLSPIYRLHEKEVLRARILHADETPHNMLEGSEKNSWYLWGFSTEKCCFFECHDTRSGDVASDILVKSNCEALMSDVYSGYGKGARQANEKRQLSGKPLIRNAYCNVHARRYFYKSWSKHKEAARYLDDYHEIYRLHSQSKAKPPPEVVEIRKKMRPLFEGMRARALEELPNYPEKGRYAKGLRYFLENYAGLTLCLEDPEVPLDNNSQEQLLRSHVVGRKTWYGTHSERGALTAAILFTLVESCRLNQVNPREYFARVVADLHAARKPPLAHEFALKS